MPELTSKQIRERFLNFFQKRGHAVIPSASLVPENDPSVLFNSAGMQPLMPYLLGKEHPRGARLVNSQKCVRTQDIDEVGDNTHDTFFEMLGNWSLGDYWKDDAIKWSYEFLTSKEDGLGLDSARLYITVFGGSDKIQRDLESVEIWKSLGIPEHRIYFKNSKSNWWSIGLNSPAGPSTEMFYDLSGTLGDANQETFEKAEEEQRVVEIWNDVFMMYWQENGEVVSELPKRNVDTGAGLERVVMAVQGKNNIFETDLFLPLIRVIEESSNIENQRAVRIVADHIRTAVFLIADGVLPSNREQGYILRRLLRRAQYYFNNKLGGSVTLSVFAQSIIDTYKDTEYKFDSKVIEKVITDEEAKFRTSLLLGLKQFEKFSRGNISGIDAFTLFSTYGFPIEMTEELAREKKISTDIDGFQQEFKKHQELSRAGAEQKFKK